MGSHECVDGSPVGRSKLILHVPTRLVFGDYDRDAGGRLLRISIFPPLLSAARARRVQRPRSGQPLRPSMRRVEFFERVGLSRESGPIVRRIGAGQRCFLEDALNGVGEHPQSGALIEHGHAERMLIAATILMLIADHDRIASGQAAAIIGCRLSNAATRSATCR